MTLQEAYRIDVKASKSSVYLCTKTLIPKPLDRIAQQYNQPSQSYCSGVNSLLCSKVKSP